VLVSTKAWLPVVRGEDSRPDDPAPPSIKMSRAPGSRVLAVLLACVALVSQQDGADAKNITISNDAPRRDTAGNIIDCHSGNILYHGGQYFMYGEHYGNSTGFGPSPPLLYPKIVVYTSPDMSAWTFRGFAVSDWPTKPYGTFFTPWAVFNERTQLFVLWFNAYLGGCCAGNWGVATSADGVNFTVVSLDVVPKYGVVDCNSLLVDDDGTAYVLYTSEAEDHRHAIEVLTPTFTNTTGVDLGLFPDHYVEGGVLFKRGSTYYVGYGSCCCFCRGGAGWVLYSAPAITGPWTRQPLDLNCNSTTAGDVCGAYGERPSDPVTIAAQGIGLSRIPLADGSTAYLWHGERWLSAADNNPSCHDECSPCHDPPSYVKGEGFSYWLPLAFNADGSVQGFGEWVSEFTLDVLVAESDGAAVEQKEKREEAYSVSVL
jgi:hypothetical protein